MNKKIISAVIFSALALCLLFAGCATKHDTDVSKAVIAQFEEFTKIPRPSLHEEKISDYLKNWAEERHYKVVQDEAHNIVFDVPATKGNEELPLVALQCHMDMVFAAKEGTDLDPLTTTINTVNDGTYLKSDGNTSIGADDGIGLAIVLCIADGKMDHGPLRVIVTTDEETSTTGVKKLDKKYYSDIDYLINVDSETEGEITVSTASCDSMVFTKEYSPAAGTKEQSYQITIKGLNGGHSGVDIDKGRLNGGIAIGRVLSELKENGIDFELQSVTGGTAGNAIISSAKAVICIDAADFEKTEKIVDECREAFADEYGSADPDMELTIAEIEMQENDVLPENEKSAAIRFLTEIINGVNTMSPDIEGLVESSSNLGVLEISPTGFNAKVVLRSNSDAREEEILKSHEQLGEKLGYAIATSHDCDAWQYKNDNILEKLFCESYRKLFGTDINVVALHAGLECGKFASENDKLNMVSIGPTVLNPHTINEQVEITSIQKVWDLLKDVLISVS